jgi:hypothetical protein
VVGEDREDEIFGRFLGSEFTVPDDDADGVGDAIEDGAPNGGDGNNDGTQDSEQANVTSLPNATSGTYVTLASPAGTTLGGVEAVDNPAPATSPAGVVFPDGFVSFSISGLAPGAATTVTIISHSATSFTTYWKYGPTADNASDHWYEFLFDGTTGVEFAADAVTVHLVDGDRGDGDLTANGTIVDPGGLGTEGASFTAPTVGLVDPQTGQWYLRDDEGGVQSFYFGDPGDVPFMGDWDCDGVATPGLFRQSDAFAYLRNDNSQGIADIRFFFGNPSDVPLAGDFNDDGCDTLSIYRPSEQRFYIMNELGEDEGGLGAADFFFDFGNPGDKPVVGDWDGDGVDEVGLHRESTGFFYYRDTLDTGIASAEFFFGDPGDRFVSGDWDATGYDKPAVFRPGNTTFYFRYTLTQGNADAQFPWGDSGWLPVAGSFE